MMLESGAFFVSNRSRPLASRRVAVALSTLKGLAFPIDRVP